MFRVFSCIQQEEKQEKRIYSIFQEAEILIFNCQEIVMFITLPILTF